MKIVFGILISAILAGCGSNSGGRAGNGGGIHPTGCPEKMDSSTPAKAAASAWNIKRTCSLSEDQIEELVWKN